MGYSGAGDRTAGEAWVSDEHLMATASPKVEAEAEAEAEAEVADGAAPEEDAPNDDSAVTLGPPADEQPSVNVNLATNVKVKPGPSAVNTYAAKKTVAQGMMDIALITSNANQLRYLLEYNRLSPTFYLNVVLITLSLMLQVAVGISLIFKGRDDLRGKGKNERANRLNNYVVIGVFLVTVINVFVAAFSISASAPPQSASHGDASAANSGA